MSDQFSDVLLRYSMIRQRAEGGITRDVLRDLNSLRDEIKGLVARVGPFGDGPLKAVRLRHLLTEIDRLIHEAESTLKESLKSGLVELGTADAAILREPLGELVDRELTGPSPAVIAGVAAGFFVGVTRSLARTKAGLFQQLTSETPQSLDDAVAMINAAFASTRLDLDRLTTTAATSVLSEVTTALYQEAGISSWHWDATLDARTCLICATNDGALLGPSDPRPPAHIRCRCVITPVIPGEERPAFESPGRYEKWLEDQPVEVQKEILGPLRYKLFLADRKKPGAQQGGLPLSLTVEDGRIIPVARLKQDWAKLLVLQVTTRLP